MSGNAQFSAGQFHDLAEALREKVPEVQKRGERGIAPCTGIPAVVY